MHVVVVVLNILVAVVYAIIALVYTIALFAAIEDLIYGPGLDRFKAFFKSRFVVNRLWVKNFVVEFLISLVLAPLAFATGYLGIQLRFSSLEAYVLLFIAFFLFVLITVFDAIDS